MDALLLQINTCSIFSQTKPKNDIFLSKGQQLLHPKDDINFFEFEEDIFVLSIVSKFCMQKNGIVS